MDGILYLTNWTEEDFTTMWGNKEYTFPAMKKTPVLIGSPEENQEIRKLFAKKLCEREIFNGRAWKNSEKDAKKDGLIHGGLYTDEDLAPLMQKCLSDLEIGSTIIKNVAEDNTADFKKYGKGQIKPIDEVEASGALASI